MSSSCGGSEEVAIEVGSECVSAGPFVYLCCLDSCTKMSEIGQEGMDSMTASIYSLSHAIEVSRDCRRENFRNHQTAHLSMVNWATFGSSAVSYPFQNAELNVISALLLIIMATSLQK